MSVRAVRARITVATVATVTAALLVPTPGGAAGSRAASRDTIDVTGTVVVLAGEQGEPDRYSLLLPSGSTIDLADGFAAEPLSRFAGSVAAPGAGSGTRLTGSLRASTLRRAASSGTPLEVVSARVAEPAPSPGPVNHTTYVAKVTNFGAIGLTDEQILATVNASQQYWVRESAGRIPAWMTATGVVPVASAAGSAAGGCGLGSGGADFGAVVQSVGSQAFPGVDFSGRSPNHLVVVVPHGCGGGTSGRARLGTSFANGGPVIIDARPQPQPTLDHEYGHNVGLQHANNATAEYGDVYEVMGSAEDKYPSPVLGTLYRFEQGAVAADEAVDGLAGGAWTLQPRSATSGLRGVYFINPDDGLRHFVDYRSGSGPDAGACYTGGACTYTTSYGQSYVPGLVLEREDAQRGAFLLGVAGNDGVLQAGEAWTNAGGSVTVTAETANRIRITRVAKPALGPGSAAVAGVPTANREVSATASLPGATSVRYQWMLNGQPVPQADDATFTPTPAMAGASLSVVATGYAVGHDPSPPAQSAAQTVAPAGWYTIGTRRSPEITGTTRVGGTLTALGLDWVDWFSSKPDGYAPTYQWSRNGNPIKGATASTYRLTSKDRGRTIQVTEYPRAAGFVTTSYARSAPTSTIRTGRLTTARPKIGGRAKVGKRVVAKTKGWTNGTKFRYQWFLGKRAIKGATKRKLQLTRSMRGKRLVVKVTGKKAGYKPASRRSRPKKVR